jgi:predicted GIY-YIG superfamily endonuclease
MSVPHWLDKVIALLQADTADLRELAHIAGGDPRIFYRGIKLEDLDIAGQNIEGMEFSPPGNQNDRRGQLELGLLAEIDERRPEHKAIRIKRAVRQEERAALLLAEFLKDRSHAMQVIDNYAKDKAKIANSVLNVLREVRLSELGGKKFNNLQIARKVSGRFGRAEDKRSVLAYFFAKHLSQYPELRLWIRGKSLSRLSKVQREEFEEFLKG